MSIASPKKSASIYPRTLKSADSKEAEVPAAASPPKGEDDELETDSLGRAAAKALFAAGRRSTRATQKRPVPPAPKNNTHPVGQHQIGTMLSSSTRTTMGLLARMWAAR